MDALQNLFNRRSVRDFTAQPIEEEKLHRILEAGMSGPCCVNARDWSFIVVTDREKLLEMAEANGRPAQPLKKESYPSAMARSISADSAAVISGSLPAGMSRWPVTQQVLGITIPPMFNKNLCEIYFNRNDLLCQSK